MPTKNPLKINKNHKKNALQPTLNTKNKKRNQVRIIGGQFKRRILTLVDADGLRPTPDRVRETIFNWLMGAFYQAKVLDMCAGSGAFGFECLSRGASLAVMIEPIKAQANQLMIQADTFAITDKVQIHHNTAQHILPKLSHHFDLVFIDPPYALNLWQTLITMLIDYQLIHQDSFIYLEGDRPLVQLIDNSNDFLIVKQHQFGQIYAYVLQWIKN